MVMDIHLNTKSLSKDLAAIRRNRSSIGAGGEIEIRLLWTDNNKNHMVRVIANSSKLWVTGYYDQNGKLISFATEGNQGVLNYADSDKGSRLTLSDVASKLCALEQIPAPVDFTAGNRNASARNAYLMCVFLASEIVRNELLEKILLLETRKPGENARTWKMYILLYKNWAKASKALYSMESGSDYPTIYAADVKSLFIRLETSDLSRTEIDLYRQLIDELQID